MKLTKKINEKFNKFYNDGQEGLMKMADMLDDENSKVHCQKCKHYLGFMKLVVKAKKVKIGEIYKVKCRKCKHINLIKKGN